MSKLAAALSFLDEGVVILTYCTNCFNKLAELEFSVIALVVPSKHAVHLLTGHIFGLDAELAEALSEVALGYVALAFWVENDESVHQVEVSHPRQVHFEGL